MKICTKCGVEKSLTDFYIRSSSPDGRKNICKKCINERMFVYSRNRYSSIDGRAKQMFNSAKSRSKKRNLEFSLDLNYVKLLLEIGYCPRTGFKFDFEVKNETYVGPFAPSLDRKDAKKGYTNDNIQIVCNIYNMGKSDNDEVDFIAVCLSVAERHVNDLAAIERLKELRNARL